RVIVPCLTIASVIFRVTKRAARRRPICRRHVLEASECRISSHLTDVPKVHSKMICLPDCPVKAKLNDKPHIREKPKPYRKIEGGPPCARSFPTRPGRQPRQRSPPAYLPRGRPPPRPPPRPSFPRPRHRRRRRRNGPSRRARQDNRRPCGSPPALPYGYDPPPGLPHRPDHRPLRDVCPPMRPPHRQARHDPRRPPPPRLPRLRRHLLHLPLPFASRRRFRPPARVESDQRPRFLLAGTRLEPDRAPSFGPCAPPWRNQTSARSTPRHARPPAPRTEARSTLAQAQRPHRSPRAL